MRADLLAMKRHNLNAVRCSHYPNDAAVPRPLRRARPVRDRRSEHREPRIQHLLCDDPRYRTPGSSAGPDGGSRSQPSVRHPVVARQRERLRREPRAARRLDPATRSVTAVALRGGGVPSRLDRRRPQRQRHRLPDVPAPSMRSSTTAGSASGTRPLIMCEYSHAMGNSNGSLWEYAEAFDTRSWAPGRIHLGVEGPRATPAICRTGAPGWPYGGSFGDVPNDGNFVADG